MKHMAVGILIGFLALGSFDFGVEAKSTSGVASYYKSGKQTANGEKFNPNGLTAAHRTLPFGTRIWVTNTRNGKSVVVRINDRGPFIQGRVIDLSLGAANFVEMTQAGVVTVNYAILN